MSSIKRMLTLFAVGCLAALVMAIPAQATSDVKADCVIDGNAKVTDKNDPQFGVRLTGGKGTYKFDSLTIACVGTAKGAPAATTLGVESNGTYSNIACGTGKAQSNPLNPPQVPPLPRGILVTSSSDGQVAKWNNILADEKYSVEFAGFAGAFWWHDSNKDTEDLKQNLGEDPDKTAPADEKDYDLGGSVLLSAAQPPPVPGGKAPVPPDTPPGNCTKAFHVTGNITIDEV